jgi:hypothetical protein
MKNFNVKFENDVRNITIEFQPRVENGNVMLDYRTTMNPMLADGEELTDDDKTLIYMADTFLGTIAGVAPDPEVTETTNAEESVEE